MVPIKGGRYEYRPDSIVALRKQLGQTQAQMAKQLGIPANTLSRWETGATKPDGEALAALYSLGAAQGFPPNFFQRKKFAPRPAKGRSRLLAMWDFQNVAVQPGGVPGLDASIRKELDGRFAAASYRRFKAFVRPDQAAAADALSACGWLVWEDDEDMDADIVAQARSDCGQEPEATTFVLIANDGDYTDLVSSLEEMGVSVYLITRGKHSKRLTQRVGGKRWIRLN